MYMQLNSRGSALIQVMIVAGILAVLSLSMASMVSGMWKDSARETAKSREVILGSAIRERLSAPELCMASLQNLSSLAENVNRPLQLKVDSTGAIAKDAAALPEWDLKVESLYMENVTKVIDLTMANQTLYSGDVKLRASSTLDANMSYKEKNLGTLYLTTTTGDTTISNCFLKDSSMGVALDTCIEANGSWSGAGGCDMTSAVEDGVCAAIGGTKNPDGSCETGESTKIQQTIAGAGVCPANQYVSGFNSAGAVNCLAFPTPVPVVVVVQPTVRGCSYSFNNCGQTAGKAPKTCCSSGEASSCSSTGSKISRCGQHNDTMGSIISYYCTCTK